MPVYSGNYSMKKFNKIKCFSYVFTVILDLGFVITACEKTAVTLTKPESVNGFKLNTFVQIDSYTSVSKNTLTEALNLCDYYEITLEEFFRMEICPSETCQPEEVTA